MYVADFSDSYFAPEDLPWADGAIRYLSPPPARKNWTGDQVRQWLSGGKSVGFVWETTETRAAQGRTAGSFDASRAEILMDVLLAPPDVAIYYAVDRNDYGPNDVRAYFGGVQSSARRPVGVYGSKEIVEAMISEGLAVYGWMVESWWAADPRPLRNPTTHLVQIANASSAKDIEFTGGFDANVVMKDDWGQWSPTRKEKGPLMALTDAQQEELYAFVRNLHSWMSKEQKGDTAAGGDGVGELGMVYSLAKRLDVVVSAMENMSHRLDGLEQSVGGVLSDSDIVRIVKQLLAGISKP